MAYVYYVTRADGAREARIRLDESERERANDTTGTVCKCGLLGFACAVHKRLTRLDGTSVPDRGRD